MTMTIDIIKEKESTGRLTQVRQLDPRFGQAAPGFGHVL